MITLARFTRFRQGVGVPQPPRKLAMDRSGMHAVQWWLIQ